MITQILFAGHGGQGILFAGKVAACAGLFDGRQVSWMPSYGPEMRGGTANCGVCLSDEPIGSPIVTRPGILVVMNTPSFLKFVPAVAPGGTVYADATLVACDNPREDIRLNAIPATALAAEHGLTGLASIILLGALMAGSGFATAASIEKALNKYVPPRKEHLREPNLRSLRLGKDCINVHTAAE